MTRKNTKNGRSASAAVKKLRSEIEQLEARLLKAKAEFEATSEFDIADAPDLLDLLVARVEREGERLYLRRGSKRVAALIPADEAEFLSEWEDRHDIEAARRALREPSKPWEQVKKELGL